MLVLMYGSWVCVTVGARLLCSVSVQVPHAFSHISGLQQVGPGPDPSAACGQRHQATFTLGYFTHSTAEGQSLPINQNIRYSRALRNKETGGSGVFFCV